MTIWSPVNIKKKLSSITIQILAEEWVGNIPSIRNFRPKCFFRPLCQMYDALSSDVIDALSVPLSP